VTPPALARRVEALLATLGLPVRLPAGVAPARLAAVMARDKKVEAGAVRFVLAAGGGRTEEVRIRPEDVVGHVPT
jgi:3-dehydroquinate synthase